MDAGRLARVVLGLELTVIVLSMRQARHSSVPLILRQSWSLGPERRFDPKLLHFVNEHHEMVREIRPHSLMMASPVRL